MIGRNLSNLWGRVLVAAFTMTAVCMMLSSTVSAQLSDQKTIVRFNSPVEIPGAGAQVLPSGTYIFKLADPKIDPNIRHRPGCPDLPVRGIGQNRDHV